MTEPEVDVLAALPAGSNPVEVVGDSALARAVRSRLAERDTSGADRPAAVVETTGDPVRIEEAIRRVADLGTVVLAGPVQPAADPLDLYSDLHLRGLTVVAIASGDDRT